MCIEIKLDQPVVGDFWFRGKWFHVEYEGLHLLCKACGIYGHVARNCPKNQSAEKNGGETIKNPVLEANPKEDIVGQSSSGNKNDSEAQS